jgi:hypothetical protein
LVLWGQVRHSLSWLKGSDGLLKLRRWNFPAPSFFLAPSRAPVGMHEPKGCSLRCLQLTVQLQVDPERQPGLGIAQLDLGGLHARRREADDHMGPPVIGDGVSDQHAAQFAPPRDVSLSLAREEAASTHQRYGLLSRDLNGSGERLRRRCGILSGSF